MIFYLSELWLGFFKRISERKAPDRTKTAPIAIRVEDEIKPQENALITLLPGEEKEALLNEVLSEVFG